MCVCVCLCVRWRAHNSLNEQDFAFLTCIIIIIIIISFFFFWSLVSFSGTLKNLIIYLLFLVVRLLLHPLLVANVPCRLSCIAGERLKNFTIEVGQMNQDGNITYTKCYFHDGPAGVIVNATCLYPVCGRFLRVIKQPTDDIPLTLCEVEVYGPDPQIRESSLSIFLAMEPFSYHEHLTRRQF